MSIVDKSAETENRLVIDRDCGVEQGKYKECILKRINISAMLKFSGIK
jgi:hypothetical protein